jgi:hypothetical protein
VHLLLLLLVLVLLLLLVVVLKIPLLPYQSAEPVGGSEQSDRAGRTGP